MATFSESTTSRKSLLKKEDELSVDIKRGKSSSNWLNFQSKKQRTEPSIISAFTAHQLMSAKTQNSNTSQKLHETVMIREKENLTRNPNGNFSTQHKVPILPRTIPSLPDFKTSVNTANKEKNSPVKRRTRVQSIRNEINASATPFVPRHTPTNQIASPSIPFANMSLCHHGAQIRNVEPVSNGIVYYQTCPQLPRHPTRIIHNSNYKLPNNFKTNMNRFTFPVRLMSTSSLVVNDLKFLQQPGVIGNKGVLPVVNQDVCVGMDCEMVGVGTGRESMLARVSLVNMSGECIYDTFVFPLVQVVDFRTSVSGVRPNDINSGADFHTVRQVVATLIHNRILVGHALKNDLEALGLTFPKKYIRDTAYYTPFQEKLHTCGPPSLKRLAQDILNVSIQDGEHSSIEDARAAMHLYILHRQDWEKQLKANRFNRR